MKLRVVLVISCAFTQSLQAQQAQAPWSHVYKKTYSRVDCKRHQKQKQILFESPPDTIPFTQLVVSFNAERPNEGGFAVFLRAHTQGKGPNEWQPWSKIATWSDSEQRTFFVRNSDAIFKHVRLEMNPELCGDGFQVRIESINDADLGAVKSIFVCASDFKEFKPESPYRASKGLASVKVEGVPKKSQKLIDHPRLGALCSPTTLSMVLEYLLEEPIDPLETARNVYDEGLDVFGSWPFNMSYAFEKSRGSHFFYVARLSSFAQLHSMLAHMPVALSVRGKIKGARKNYPNGHLLVSVGYDAKKKQVLCFDPAFDTLEQVEVAYDIAEFLPAWERSNRLIYCVHPRA